MAQNGWIFATTARNADGRTGLRINATCEVCGAYLENCTNYYRCPWTTRTRRAGGASIDGVQVITCDWPRGGPRDEVAAPITGGTR